MVSLRRGLSSYIDERLTKIFILTMHLNYARKYEKGAPFLAWLFNIVSKGYELEQVRLDAKTLVLGNLRYYLYTQIISVVLIFLLSTGYRVFKRNTTLASTLTLIFQLSTEFGKSWINTSVLILILSVALTRSVDNETILSFCVLGLMHLISFSPVLFVPQLYITSQLKFLTNGVHWTAYANSLAEKHPLRTYVTCS